jgi:hypothetical protein
VSSIARKGVGTLRRIRTFFVLSLVGSALALTAAPEIVAFQLSKTPISLTGSAKPPESLSNAATPVEIQSQKASQSLSQFYTAEYSAIMARISAWTSLQYAIFPILVAACAMLTKLDNVRANFRWWAAIGALLVGYLAYQGTMLDTLQKVLFIERYLQPLARQIVGIDQFWIHECIYRQSQVANIFFWKYWPPIICLSATIAAAIHVRIRHGFGRWDYILVSSALLLTGGVLDLTIQGSWLEQDIVDACQARTQSLVDLFRPNNIDRQRRLPPMLQLNHWTPEDLLKAIALTGAAIAFAIGLAQYRRAQQWKRAEWVAQEMKQLFSDPTVQAALLMIDWGSRQILLYPEREKIEDRYVQLTNEMVARALMPHEKRQGSEKFTNLEADIRAAFDRALDGLERFHSYVATGLVKISDLQPYLKYWAVNLIRDQYGALGEDRIATLIGYMDKYGFDGAHKLLRDIAAAEGRASSRMSGNLASAAKPRI